ncbi:MAG: transcription antitermination factor NusB [Rhodopirellula sp.]|nr:transcription antitermination factor NusB [Rhodopirellula sp.]
MSSRRRAREIVLQLLYEADVNDSRDAVEAKKFIRSRMQGRSALTDFADALLRGTLKHRDEVDQRLKRLATRWSLSRMPVVDRNILRLGGYEILFGDTPDRVAVNEAILLAKRYGDKSSPRFVNGILDRLMNMSAEELDAADAGVVSAEEPSLDSNEGSTGEDTGDSDQAGDDTR